MYLCDEMFNQVVAGGGAVEAALSVYLEYLATTLGSREQLAIAEFAESLLIIPKVSYGQISEYVILFLFCVDIYKYLFKYRFLLLMRQKMQLIW